jgi:type II secretory pathway pseudopilin PulG
MPSSALSKSRGSEGGFTTTELLVAIGLIIVLLAIILPAVNHVRSQAIMSQSMSNMQQTARFMQLYAKDNREIIVPSRFDYSDTAFSYKGRVATDPGIPSAEQHRGTWADILWTINEIDSFTVVGQVVSIDGEDVTIGHNYATKAPDRLLYEAIGNWKGNPFRSTAMNSKNFERVNPGQPNGLPDVVNEMGFPGFFAANDFFDARPNDDNPTGRWYTTGQIRSPERSMYLVDSFAGPVISPEPAPFNTQKDSQGRETIEVDFRYSGVCLMLFLDGSVRPQNRWEDICELECNPDPDAACDCTDPNYTNRAIRISNLTGR